MAGLQQSFASLDFCFFLSRKRKKPVWLRQKKSKLRIKFTIIVTPPTPQPFKVATKGPQKIWT
ncbi:hypothetical protein DHW03_13240 [Pedobacter yonginense]|uniref:Uncharacterized protein n=1 Tax=Pedobacter yonginense TaxID=651869 RepID=A0A317EPF7_9SPHI|nr:hypothetical protein DHW03_13240 [Pedobacter yonginense]